MRVELRHGIGRARIERRLLALHFFLDQAEHLRGGGLIEAGLGIDQAHRLQHVAGAERGDRTGQQGLLPGRLDEGLGGEIVDLVGLDVLDGAHQARQVGEVSVDQLDIVGDAKPAQADVADLGGAGPAHQTADAIALAQKQLREIGAVLAGDASDQGSLVRHCLLIR